MSKYKSVFGTFPSKHVYGFKPLIKMHAMLITIPTASPISIATTTTVRNVTIHTKASK